MRPMQARRTSSSSPFTSRAREAIGVDRFDHLDAGELLSLVRLNVADHVPARIARKLGSAALQVLHVVLAEHALSSGIGRFETRPRLLLRDCDERDLFDRT